MRRGKVLLTMSRSRLLDGVDQVENRFFPSAKSIKVLGAVKSAMTTGMSALLMPTAIKEA